MKPATAACIAGLTGAAVMVLELTAVRLMAPHFGDSAYVWTNVIGVILVALALGAYLGGRMADHEMGGPRLFWLLLAAGALTSAVPVVAHPLGSWLVPPELPLDSAMGALVRGSLAATTILFAPPILLVALVSPILVALLASQDGRVGRAAGLVSAMATIGSLAGTFAATHLLIPGVGSRWTVWIAAGLLIVAGLLCRGRPAAAAALLLPVGLSLLVPDVLKPVGPGERLVAEVESNYQFLQVVERTDAGRRQLSLKINEGLDSFHSVAIEGTAFTDGSYYDFHVIAPYLARDGGDTAGVRVLSLGEAAGTFGRLFAHVHPRASMDGVEIDPEVMRLGRQHFQGPRPPGRHYPVDARVFVENTGARYDVVLVDTYKNQIYIPAHVSSEQFFRAVARVLRDGGVVSVNSGGVRFDDPAVQALASTMAAVFGESWGFRVPRSRNFVLMARKGRDLDPARLGQVRTSDGDLRRILAQTSPMHAWRRFERGPVVLQDDRPLLDVLQARAYDQRAGAVELTPITGARVPREVEAEVLELYRQGRLEAALAAVATAEAATPLLRRRAGDCRWMLRDTQGAVREYEEALRLGSEDPGLRRDIGYAEEETAGRQLAWSTATRNGWVALLAVAGLLGLVGFAAARTR